MFQHKRKILKNIKRPHAFDILLHQRQHVSAWCPSERIKPSEMPLTSTLCCTGRRVRAAKLVWGRRSLTWGPSGCCRWRASGPGSPLGGGWGLICCRETPRMSSTAACGTAPRSRRSLRVGTSRWHSGSLFSAGGRSQHRGRTGLWQERRDKTERSGDARRSGGWGLKIVW